MLKRDKDDNNDDYSQDTDDDDGDDHMITRTTGRRMSYKIMTFRFFSK